MGLLGLNVFISVMAIGGVHLPVMVVIAILSTCACSISIYQRREHDRVLPITWPAILLWALSAWSIFQLVPLPLSALASFAPSNADVWQRALTPLGEPPISWAPISLDPSATIVEALRWWTYGALFTTATAVSSRRSPRWGITLVFAVAVTAAATTLAHGLLSASKVFGLYSPSFQPQPWHVGPLLNPNNLAGLLNLGALCGLGLLTSRSVQVPRWLLALGIALVLGIEITSGSRAGVLLLICGVIALATVTERRQRRSLHRSSPPAARPIFLATIASGIGLAILASTNKLWDELLSTNIEKLSLASMVIPMIRAHPFVGIGRGSFESVFPAYQSTRSGTVFTDAENFPVQWAAEWGLPVTIAALLAFTWFLSPRRLGAFKSTTTTGAWIGALVLISQNLIDLGLEVPGLCIATSTVLGSIAGAASPDTLYPRPRALLSRNSAKWASVVAGVGIALSVVAGTFGGDVTTAKRHIYSRLLESTSPRDPAARADLRSELRESMLAHPADPYFPLLGATLAWQEGDQSPLPWIQRSLERSMNNGGAHLLLAHVVRRYGSIHQALLELRLAIEGEALLLGPAARLAAAWSNDPSELGQMVPTGDLQAPAWAALGAFHHDRTVASVCDERALAIDPRLAGPRRRIAEDLIRSAHDNRRCIDDLALCRDTIHTLVTSLEQLEPDSSIAAQLLARWFAATGDPERGVAHLNTVCERTSDNISCLHTRAEISAAIPGPDAFSRSARSLRLASCSTRKRCASTCTWIGDLHVHRREWGSATTSYERAVREEPTAQRLLKLADAARRAGMTARGIRALDNAEKLGVATDEQFRKSVKTLRRQLLESHLAR